MDVGCAMVHQLPSPGPLTAPGIGHRALGPRPQPPGPGSSSSPEAHVDSCEFASRSTRAHQDHFNHSVVKQYIMVRTPFPIDKALQIPGAVKALDAEWDKLAQKLQSWDVTALREKSRSYKRSKKERSASSLCYPPTAVPPKE